MPEAGPKIAVYAICLNERPFVERFIETARNADVIVVADTGSTDGSAEALKAGGAVVHHIRVQPWRFDDARNAALSLIPGDVDLCVSLDLDQTLSPQWREAITSSWRPGINLIYYDQLMERRANGAHGAIVDNRVHARFGLRWKSPCHEYLVFDRDEERSVRIEGYLVEHHPDLQKSRSQYLPLLELAVQEDQVSGRASHVLARELRLAGRDHDAVREFERYLDLAPSSPEERSLSLRLLGMSMLTLGNPQDAIARFQQATRETPELNGAWVDLACALYQQSDWAGCLDACERAIATPIELAEYGATSSSGAIPEDLASVCAWRLGDQPRAVEFARRAVFVAPGVQRLRDNLATMELALKQGR